MRPILSGQIVNFLNASSELGQNRRSTTFGDGLNRAAEAFRQRFTVLYPGLRRPYWLNEREIQDYLMNSPPTLEMISSKQDFRRHALELEGSRDLGAQLFCALLRSANVDARLVCSLQVLPFSNVARGVTPDKKSKSGYILPGSFRGQSEPNPTSPKSSNAAREVPRPRQRFSNPSFTPKNPKNLAKSPVNQTVCKFIRIIF